MKQIDLDQLTPHQRLVLQSSFQPGLSEKRIRNILISGGLALLTVLVFTQWGVTVLPMAILAGTIVAISMVEKISYARELLIYKSLVRSLVNRAEALEGHDPTPADASERVIRPTRSRSGSGSLATSPH